MCNVYQKKPVDCTKNVYATFALRGKAGGRAALSSLLPGAVGRGDLLHGDVRTCRGGVAAAAPVTEETRLKEEDDQSSTSQCLCC